MIFVAIVLFGLCLGSFAGALVWRIHEQELSSAKDSRLSIVNGRSMCPNCHHQLAWYDLLPVASWLALKGKCRYCHVPISWRYPALELANAALFAGSYLLWPFGFTSSGLILFILWLAIITLFVALIIYDWLWMILPNRLVFPLVGLSIIFVSVRLALSPQPLAHNLIMLGLSVLTASGLFWVLHMVSRGRWIGGGDVKLGLSLGLILTRPEYSLLMIFIASVIGSIFALPAYIKNRRNSRIPFGPFLILSTIIVLFYGPTVIGWYLNFLQIN